MIDLKAFRKANHLTQIDLADYLGVGQGFISQIEKGDRPLPKESISRILANPYGWDASGLVDEPQPEDPVTVEPDAMFIKEKLLVHIERQDSTIKMLLEFLKEERDKVEYLEEELRAYREHKGETVRTVGDSSAANVG